MFSIESPKLGLFSLHIQFAKKNIKIAYPALAQLWDIPQ